MLLAASYLVGMLVLVTAGALALAAFLWVLSRSKDPKDILVRTFLAVGVLAFGYWSINSLAGDGNPMGQVAGVFMAVAFGLILAIIWAPPFMEKVAEWIGSLYTGSSAPPDPEPFYSPAMAKRKQGKFREAIYDIQEQLALFPDDVKGHVMLAEIQAENLHDLSAAQISIERFCEKPERPPAHISYALTALADWHLKMAKDTDAARAALEKIRELLPDTEQAMMAAQRLAHLASPEMLLAEQEHKPFHLRDGAVDIGLMKNSSSLAKAVEDPAETAAKLVKQLETHPLDCEAREKLAVLYSEHFNRLDLATGELEQLIATPHQPPKEVVHWLNVLADFQVRHDVGYDAVRATLERIIQRFPGVAAERLAQQRIEHLRLEFKGREKGKSVHLGDYEKDLGLKKRRPS